MLACVLQSKYGRGRILCRRLEWERGAVSSRVALLLRSAEAKPLFYRFVRLFRELEPPSFFPFLLRKGGSLSSLPFCISSSIRIETGVPLITSLCHSSLLGMERGSLRSPHLGMCVLALIETGGPYLFHTCACAHVAGVRGVPVTALISRAARLRQDFKRN